MAGSVVPESDAGPDVEPDSEAYDAAEELDMLEADDSTLPDSETDAGYSPPERPLGMAERRTLDQKLAQEEPEDEAGVADDGEFEGGAGRRRSGRLVADGTPGAARDVGIAGAGASAEEAAVHTVEDEDVDTTG